MKVITHPFTLRRFGTAIFCILALPLIHFVSRSNYNLFHSFADGASIVIAASTFTIIWNSRHRINNDYFLFTGIAFFFFSFLDAMHLLGNKNMGVFPAYGNLGPTFYIASRYLLSVSLLCAPLFIHRRLKAPVILAAYSLVCAIVVLSVFYWKVFPICIVEGVGLTPFKVVSDYIICLILVGSIVLLLRHRESFDPRVLRIIVSSIVLSIATGLAFTLYTDPFGITNMVGHLFQLASFYLVYIAFIETSLTKPHEILFRELKQNEEKLIQNLRKLDEANVELNHEIAERKLAEDGLRHNREWLRVTLSSIGDAVLATDTEGRITFLNPVAEEITGWKLEEAIGTPVRNVFRTIDEETHLPGEDIVGRVLRDGLMVNLANHTSLIARDGLEIPIQDSAAPITDTSGRISGVVLVFHDVSEQRKAQNELRTSELRFKLLSDTAGRLLTSNDPQGLVNELCRKIIAHLGCHAFFNFLLDERTHRLHLNAYAGIPADEAARIEWLDFGVAICGCAAQEGERIIAEDILNTYDIRTELVKSYGIQAYACHPLVSQGKVIGTLSFGTKSRPRFSSEEIALMKTVTDQVAAAMERMRLIGELRESNEEMEHRVQKRTAELALTNRALREYSAKLERLNKELEEFAWISAHDLQEPLRKIQTFGSRLQKMQASLNQGGREYVRRMVESAGRMASLIMAIRNYSDISQDGNSFEPTNLTEVVYDARSDLEILVRQAQARIEVSELPLIDVNRTGMRQLFQNLICNSLKYSREEENPVVRISSQTEDGICRIHVEDNGIGFDEQYLDRIFRPFQRLHGRNSPYGGTGMGLAICRKVVERHGGTITARSIPGQGSTFIITLPIKQENSSRSLS